MRRGPPKAIHVARRAKVPCREARRPGRRRGTGRPAGAPRGAGLPRPAVTVLMIRPGPRRAIAAEPGRPAKASRLPPGETPARSVRLRRAEPGPPALRRVPVTGTRGPAPAGGVPARLGRRVPRAIAIARGVTADPPALRRIPVTGARERAAIRRARPARLGRRIPRAVTAGRGVPAGRRIPVSVNVERSGPARVLSGASRPAPVRPARAGRLPMAVGRGPPARRVRPARLGRGAPRTLAAEILSRARRPAPAGRIRPACAGRRVPRAKAVGRRLPARASGPARLGGRWPGGPAACGRVPVRRDVVRRRPAEVLGGACRPAPIRRGLPAEGRVPVPAGRAHRPGSLECGRAAEALSRVGRAAAAGCTRPVSLGRAEVLRRARGPAPARGVRRASRTGVGRPARVSRPPPGSTAALGFGPVRPGGAVAVRRLAPAQGAEPVAVGCAEVLARPRGPAIALASGAVAGVSRPPREAASTLGVRGLGRAEILSRAASPVTVGAGPAFSYGATVLGRPPRRTPATRGVRLAGSGRAEVLSRAAGRAGDIESGGRAWVLSRAEPVGNGAAVLVPPPRGTPATGSVGLTVRRRARDVKGGSRVKVPSRAAIGARPAGRRRGGRGIIGLGRPPRGTPATRSVSPATSRGRRRPQSRQSPEPSRRAGHHRRRASLRRTSRGHRKRRPRLGPEPSRASQQWSRCPRPPATTNAGHGERQTGQPQASQEHRRPRSRQSPEPDRQAGHHRRQATSLGEAAAEPRPGAAAAPGS